MAKQTFTTGQVLTAAQMTSLQETAMGGGPATAKTASYVLVAADAGTTVAMNAAGATTITVNTGLFAAGDTVFIQNLGAGACTVTAGTATVATAGSLILPQNDAGILYFTATGAAIFYDYIQAGAVSPLTTKGDLYTFSTSDARLGVGANGTTLVADSAEATGLKWATPAAGGMTLITTSVPSAISSLDFTSISSSYKHLMVEWLGIYQSSSGNVFDIRLNADSGSNYKINGTALKNTTLESAIASDTAATGSGQMSGEFYLFSDSVTSTNLQNASQGKIIIYNYADTTYYKKMEFQFFSASSTARKNVYMSTVYASASAITQINIFRYTGSGTFSAATGGYIRLWGIS